MAEGRDTTTVYLADGRVLKRERTRDFVDVSVDGWQEVEPSAESFTLDGTLIRRDEAEALIAQMDENVCDGNA